MAEQALLEDLLQAYQRHFDIERNVLLGETPVAAHAHFYSRGEKYVLSKKAKLWGVECNEHTFFIQPETLDEAGFAGLMQALVEQEPNLVKPHPEHMYTYLSAILLVPELTAGLARAVRRYKWRKSYKLSFQGWCQIRVAAVDLATKQIAVNHDGRELKKSIDLVCK